MAMDRETFERVFGIKLNELAREQWYRKHGWVSDVGFERVSDRSNVVRCIICGRHGVGAAGKFPQLQWDDLRRWQQACMTPHTEPCACGKYFPTKHALAMHVQATRRHRIPGHGRLDQIG